LNKRNSRSTAKEITRLKDPEELIHNRVQADTTPDPTLKTMNPVLYSSSYFSKNHFNTADRQPDTQTPQLRLSRSHSRRRWIWKGAESYAQMWLNFGFSCTSTHEIKSTGKRLLKD